jgi:hypothetical protein
VGHADCMPFFAIVSNMRRAFTDVAFVETAQHFCDDTTCRAMADGKLLYMSGDHLTPHGSRYLLRRIRNELSLD